jgi:hypothetical protein
MTNSSVHRLVAMLQYMRPAYSHTERLFCERYLEPIFGKPDEHGNYIKVIGDRPNIAFTAHTDTVHKVEGIQTLKIEGDFITTTTGSCLGADCTTGLWLLVGMIEAGVEGVYVAHAAEEIGGIGSTRLVADRPSWINELDAVISFDRFGTESIITHQGGCRTASDEFSKSLAVALDLPMRADTYGTYTDSLEYAEVVSECTNLSVGYFDQHTTREAQDLHFAQVLLERLIAARWDTLAIVRDPTHLETLGGNYRFDDDNNASDEEDVDALERLLVDRPTMMAQLLFEYGFTVEALADELNLSYTDLDYYLDGRLHQYN